MADTAQKRSRAKAGAAQADPADESTDETLGSGAAAAVAAHPEAEALLEELHHRRGCPAREQGLDGARIEVIEHKVSGKGLDPERGGSNDGDAALIVRCVECGAQFPDE